MRAFRICAPGERGNPLYISTSSEDEAEMSPATVDPMQYKSESLRLIKHFAPTPTERLQPMIASLSNDEKEMTRDKKDGASAFYTYCKLEADNGDDMLCGTLSNIAPTSRSIRLPSIVHKDPAEDHIHAKVEENLDCCMGGLDPKDSGQRAKALRPAQDATSPGSSLRFKRQSAGHSAVVQDAQLEEGTGASNQARVDERSEARTEKQRRQIKSSRAKRGINIMNTTNAQGVLMSRRGSGSVLAQRGLFLPDMPQGGHMYPSALAMCWSLLPTEEKETQADRRWVLGLYLDEEVLRYFTATTQCFSEYLEVAGILDKPWSLRPAGFYLLHVLNDSNPHWGDGRSIMPACPSRLPLLNVVEDLIVALVMRKLGTLKVTWRDLLGNLPQVLPCNPLYEVWIEPSGSLLEGLKGVRYQGSGCESYWRTFLQSESACITSTLDLCMEEQQQQKKEQQKVIPASCSSHHLVPEAPVALSEDEVSTSYNKHHGASLSSCKLASTTCVEELDGTDEENMLPAHCRHQNRRRGSQEAASTEIQTYSLSELIASMLQNSLESVSWMGMYDGDMIFRHACQYFLSNPPSWYKHQCPSSSQVACVAYERDVSNYLHDLDDDIDLKKLNDEGCLLSPEFEFKRAGQRPDAPLAQVAYKVIVSAYPSRYNAPSPQDARGNLTCMVNDPSIDPFGDKDLTQEEAQAFNLAATCSVVELLFLSVPSSFQRGKPVKKKSKIMASVALPCSNESSRKGGLLIPGMASIQDKSVDGAMQYYDYGPDFWRTSSSNNERLRAVERAESMLFL
ncbi:hypothetical protein CEUSTIGMA_g4681.t1 [Chlamydomonas eustigma]|uniref:Uncharacterized protein n=1 Tax=Chlamydomonas eustigma TaxID=1157962 RepID=A0A250X2F2_9CHLO|nr:hypothetical protein CEUSTIGMA_g4681.t1 [Chlamydomonas eustigma]|eukprot:GAX77235.1 hypothetical protein CEUSTIGMA_g4681.t1 [Chlamydomonas eustigma]